MHYKDHTMRNLGFIALFVIVVISGIMVWQGYRREVQGTVAAKRIEKIDNYCDPGGKCSLILIIDVIQMQDGSVYEVYWSRDIERIQPGKEIKFHAEGYDIRIFGFTLSRAVLSNLQLISP